MQGTLPTENRLEDTDGLLALRPPWKGQKGGGKGGHSIGAVACGSLLLLTCALLVTSSHFEGLQDTGRGPGADDRPDRRREHRH